MADMTYDLQQMQSSSEEFGTQIQNYTNLKQEIITTMKGMASWTGDAKDTYDKQVVELDSIMDRYVSMINQFKAALDEIIQAEAAQEVATQQGMEQAGGTHSSLLQS